MASSNAGEYSQVMSSIKTLKLEGKNKVANKMLEKYRELLMVTSPMKEAAKALPGMNKCIDRIVNDRSLTPKQKR